MLRVPDPRSVFTLNSRPDQARPSARKLFLPLASCLALGFVLLLVLRPTPQPVAALPEVARTNLVRSDGRWCRLGQTNPFTGVMLEHYANGVLQSRAVLSNGLLEGRYESWHTNGQLAVQEYYCTNCSNGLRTKWYPDGKKLSESTIVRGKLQGTFRRWYENGKLAEEIPMRDGKIEGVGRSWYESGFQKTRLTLHDGQIVDSKTWEDGQQPGGQP